MLNKSCAYSIKGLQRQKKRIYDITNVNEKAIKFFGTKTKIFELLMIQTFSGTTGAAYQLLRPDLL